jgi:Ca-activated chloride channel family protein
MLQQSFAYPLLLFGLAALPLLGLLAVWSGRKRRRGLARFGNLATLEALLAARRRRRWFRGLCLLLGLVGVGMGMAGPQWGRDWDQSAAPGRDVVVALDCSRSMLAEKPSRLQRAQTALLDLSRAIEKRGGHRVGLVVFAGRARLACPLTHDYDHFRDTVQAVDPHTMDPDLEPGPTEASGTRIGLGLFQAVLAHDARFQSARDILLLSDGDDPARDGEYRYGAAEARAQGIAIHTIGIGDPNQAHPIPLEKDVLQHEGREVRTRLEIAPLREIAEMTSGIVEIAGTRTLPLGSLYLDLIAQQPVREESDDALPVFQQRYAWFLAPAFMLLTFTMTLADRPRARRRKERTSPLSNGKKP